MTSYTFCCPVCGFVERYLCPVVAVGRLGGHVLGTLIADDEYDRLCAEVLEEAVGVLS